MNTKTSILSLLLLAVVLVPVLSGCSSNADGATEEETEAPSNRRTTRVETQTVTPMEFVDIVELTGSVEAVNDATLSAQASGTVTRLASLGTYMQRGDVVAQLRPNAAQAQVEQAEAQFESAQAQFELARDNYERMKPLYADSIISAVEFENARTQYNQALAAVNQARAALAGAREQVENTRIRAPFGGTVEQRFAELGEQIMPGTPVVRVVDIDPVKVVAGVPERYAGDVEEGTPVEIDFKAYGGTSRRGTVTFAGSTIDPDSRTFPVEVVLDNPDRLLKPQMVARLHVPRETLEGALVVPRSAVVRDENTQYVYVVEETEQGPVAQQRTVTLGSSYGDRVVVQSGLEAGEQVVVAGQNNVTTGDALEIVSER